MKIQLLIGILTIQIFGCDNSATFSEAEKEIVSMDVKAMLHDYHDSMNNGGLLTEFEFLDNSAEFFWIPPGYSTPPSYDSVATVLEKLPLPFIK